MYLDEIISGQKKGETKGIVSICSAHPYVLEAAFRQALHKGTHVLIESTCNQVNQFGGYSKMTPSSFVLHIWDMAARIGFPQERLILGGDHLGPEVWQVETSASAMDKANTLVRDYVGAGYVKIHLDASMKLADDPIGGPLDKSVSAARAAEMAKIAEETHRARSQAQGAPRYVIGTDVPMPGGAKGREERLQVTAVADISETIEITRLAFYQRGLHKAWERVIAVVVQPGVEYSDDLIFKYDRAAAVSLTSFIEQQAGLVYEAHSTDYQSLQALRQMVEDHFAILKVGPALTFAYREAVFALALIEDELLQGRDSQRSGLLDALESAMLTNPRHWSEYYSGGSQAQRLARRYSLSDRVRYYWITPAVQQALNRLFSNLSRVRIPLTLLSQYLPIQYARHRQGLVSLHPKNLVLDKIRLVLDEYDYACGLDEATGIGGC